MLEERVVWIRFRECLLVGVRQVEVVEAEDDSSEVVGCGLEGALEDGNEDGFAGALDAVEADEEGHVWVGFLMG